MLRGSMHGFLNEPCAYFLRRWEARSARASKDDVAVVGSGTAGGLSGREPVGSINRIAGGIVRRNVTIGDKGFHDIVFLGAHCISQGSLNRTSTCCVIGHCYRTTRIANAGAQIAFATECITIKVGYEASGKGITALLLDISAPTHGSFAVRRIMEAAEKSYLVSNVLAPQVEKRTCGHWME